MKSKKKQKTNQNNNTNPCPKKQGIFIFLPKLQTQNCAICMQKCKTYANVYCLHTKCYAYAMQLNYIILN